VHFDADFNRQKTQTVTRSLGTRILRFSRETKLTNTVQKLSKNSQPDQGADGRTIPLNTPVCVNNHKPTGM